MVSISYLIYYDLLKVEFIIIPALKITRYCYEKVLVHNDLRFICYSNQMKQKRKVQKMTRSPKGKLPYNLHPELRFDLLHVYCRLFNADSYHSYIFGRKCNLGARFAISNNLEKC